MELSPILNFFSTAKKKSVINGLQIGNLLAINYADEKSLETPPLKLAFVRPKEPPPLELPCFACFHSLFKGYENSRKTATLRLVFFLVKKKKPPLYLAYSVRMIQKVFLFLDRRQIEGGFLFRQKKKGLSD